MSIEPIPGLKHAIDRLVISGRRVFGWGWAAHPAQAVKAVRLRIRGDGWEKRLAAGAGLTRSDVEKEHPHLLDAGTSGFVVTGFITEAAPAQLALEVELADGRIAEFDVTHSAETLYAHHHKRRQLGWVARSVWRRLKHGDIRGILRRARAQSYSAPSVDDMSIVEELLPVLRSCGDLCVVFDHNMGGGSNQYRRGIVAARLAAGQSVLLCTYNLPTLDYRLVLSRPGHDEQVFRTSTFLVLDNILEDAPVTELFVNSPVSFDEPLLLADWLARTRAEHPKARLTVTAHDYFAVCPSFVLLNADGRYCGIPEISECNACLKRHQASYVALSPPTEIAPWRALWGRCLMAADEVRCFSQSTRELLLRAYPSLAPERITVVPHRVDYVPSRLPRFDPRAPLTIGIVGEISVQKGALVVQEMLALIERDHPDVRVVVIGTLDLANPSPRLRVTGRYRQSELADLAESHGVNMFFFPSIWPETFSYVVAEMAELRLPIVAFALGAPMERLRAYPMSRLVREVSAAAALEALVGFHRELADTAASAA
jgi:glycosyltransferase involved in cell wall biosynthesis